MVGDRPQRSRIIDAGGISDSDTTISLPAGQVRAIAPSPGAMVEFDDGSDERVEIIGTDPDADTIEVLRAREGTTAAAHVENAGLLFGARFSYTRIADAIADITEGELWPWVWLAKETTLSYEADGHYNPSVPDIEKVVSIWQTVAGERYDLQHQYRTPEVAENTNGLIYLPEHVDTSTIYVAYRARITLANAPERILRLITIGAVAELMEQEETTLVAPDPGKVMGGVQEGARVRSGRLLWERFTTRRAIEKVTLEQAESVLW